MKSSEFLKTPVSQLWGGEKGERKKGERNGKERRRGSKEERDGRGVGGKGNVGESLPHCHQCLRYPLQI